jgi:hypothetical protein
MTEAEWLACTDPSTMEAFLQNRTGQRKARLFFCACCRHIWDLMTDERCQRGVITAEVFADGEASLSELEMAHKNADAAAFDYIYDVSNMAEMTTQLEVDLNGWISITSANHSYDDLEWYCGPLRCIYGNSFRPVLVDPAWLTPNVAVLAQAAYNQRELPSGQLDLALLAVLADALEEAGCDNTDILTHLRGPGPHVRGCWVLDLVRSVD